MKLRQLPLRQLERHLERQARPSCPYSTRRLPPQTSLRVPCRTQSPSSPICGSRRTYATAVSASQLLFGQPVHETHPHLLKPAELTQGITAQEYHQRRANLCHSLPKDSAVILPSATLKYRSGAVFHGFRQESNFLYLTGFSEPDSFAVLKKTGDYPDDYVFHLYCRPKDPKAEQWNGPWSGVDAARDVWNADVAGDIHRLDALLPDALRGVKKVFTDAELTKYGAPTKFGNLLRSAAPNVATSPLKPHINVLRAVKSCAETANMRRAGQESGRALTEAMRRPWSSEKQLAAFLENQYHISGLDGQAYVPVVAGGQKALLIHYVLNNGMLNESEFVLVDAGGEYGTYITDITRTWPVSGKFSQPQKDLYNAVLRAQRSSISLCCASANVTLDKLHSITETALREQLQQLGFDLSGNGMDVLFPHHVGHYIGLDVHDVPGYPRNVVLKEGHCITIEPGVYVPDDERFPKAFRGMGIRIEDSICVGSDNPFMLTTDAVKEVDDIEALRG
ncbi:Uu.00g123500.m01.CDS01 [Anthostomella pinea]|uniref:Xaa-Pro aminopeptidase n=1 Tax=Anthostomella pinea TaxID=933095 RepID=A0AAI8VHY1_9PEZI|nr:Uu.00g123500.m01.CDS01 [Anthostomella pinea]